MKFHLETWNQKVFMQYVNNTIFFKILFVDLDITEFATHVLSEL